MALQKLLKPFSGAAGAPIYFLLLPPPEAAVSPMGADGASNAAPKAVLPQRAREMPLRAAVS